MDASTEDSLESAEGVPSLAWLNLTYQVSVFARWKREKKPILRGLNGTFAWHSLNGLLGPSGAGKTTLLNCLVGTLPCQEGSHLYVDGGGAVAPVACLVEQHVQEGIAGRLTVRQILQYAYDFKNGRCQGETREAAIRTALEDMMLDEALLSVTFGRCSGGEQKRISIAQELLAQVKPSFLALDEPTTGLDSQAAYLVMSCLKRLAARYRMTVIASVHVPNEQTLALFDKLYVLAKGGLAIYSGAPEGLQAALESQLGRGPLGQEEKPIEVAMQVTCVTDGRVRRLANVYLAEEYSQVSRHLSRLRPHESAARSQQSGKSFRLSDLLTSTQRYSRVVFLTSYRGLLFQLLLYSGTLLLFASIFDHAMTHPDGCQNVSTHRNVTLESGGGGGCSLADEHLLNENIKYLLFGKLMIGNLLGASSYLLFTQLTRNVQAEIRNKWYSLGVSYLSLTLVSLAELTVSVILISAIGYFASEQVILETDTWEACRRLGHYTLSLWLHFLYVQTACQLVGVYLSAYIEIGASLTILVSMAFQVLDDFFYLTEQLDSWPLRKLTELAAVKWTSRYMLYAIYGIGRCNSVTEFSAILAKRYVDVPSLAPNLARVLLNILSLRLLTFLLLYVKYGSSLGRIFAWKRENRKESLKLPPLVPFPSDDGDEPTFGQIEEMKDIAPQSEQANERLQGKSILAWQQLSLFSGSSIYELGTSSPSSQHPILRSLSGSLTFGSLNGLMGMSGAGKTSLLRVLNGQSQTRLDRSTQFFISTAEPIRTCYITQNVADHLLPGLTVKQAIVYASRLKNLHCTLDHEKVASRLLVELDLMEAASTNVARCSGGERKRLALALELTPQKMPNLVCIDEPTSGLDSSSAHKVVSCLRTLAHHYNLAIVSSLHQPSTELLTLFDTLYVLARGGQCVFSGPPGAISEHLRSIPGVDLSESKYPIEVLIKHSCSPADSQVVAQLVARQASAQLSSEMSLLGTRPLFDGVPPNRTRFSLASFTLLSQRYLASYRGHLWVHLVAFTFIYLVLGPTIGLLFDSRIALASGCLSLEDDFNKTCGRRSAQETLDAERLESNLYYNFLANNYFLSLALLQAALTLFYEMPLFLNEHRNGWFSSGSFYLMKSLFEIVPSLPIVALFVYFIDIYESVQPGLYWSLLLVYLLSLLAYQSVAHVCVLLAGRSVLLVSCLSIVAFILSLLLSNVMVSLRRMHYLFQYAANFSVSRFSLEASLLLQYGFGRCPPGHLQATLYWMGLQDSDYAHSLLMLTWNILFYRCLALWLLVRRANPVEDRRERAARISAHWESSSGEHQKSNPALVSPLTDELLPV